MSMKVEKSTLDQVKKRFEFNKKAKEQKEKEYGVSFLVLVRTYVTLYRSIKGTVNNDGLNVFS